jgi:ribosomal protein S17
MMLKALSKAIEDQKDFLPEGAEPWQRCRLVESGLEAGLTRATEVVSTVADAHKAIQPLLEKALPGLSESEVEDVCLSHSSILGKLLPVRTDDMRKERSWSMIRKDVRLALVHIHTCLESLLKSTAFSLQNAEKLELATRQAEESLNAAAQRLEEELVSDARVLLSTIGSSHKLPVDGDDEEDGGGVLGALSHLKICSSQMKKTIVVFDEAGCIPSYELLGLSRLGRSIDSLVCVGDKNQLPPYDPSSSRDYNKNRNGPRGANARQRSVTQETSVKSLLDVSKLTTDTGKVKLTRQYRVPRDIANLLNARIYLGDYVTAAECRAPSRGFNFVDVPEDRRQGGRKYVNDAEIQYCLELVRQSKREGRTSIMVLTPVSCFAADGPNHTDVNPSNLTSLRFPVQETAA